MIKIFVTLTTDEREHAVAAVISPENHLAIYLSRKLAAAESNYLNIEKEAQTIMWNTEKAGNFLLWWNFFL